MDNTNQIQDTSLILPAIAAPQILAKIQEYYNLTTSYTQKSIQKTILNSYPEIITFYQNTQRSVIESKLEKCQTEIGKQILELCLIKEDLNDLKKKAVSVPNSKAEYHNSITEKEQMINDTMNQIQGQIALDNPEILEQSINNDSVLDYNAISRVLSELSKLLLEQNIDISKLSTTQLKTVLASINSLNSFLS